MLAAAAEEQSRVRQGISGAREALAERQARLAALDPGKLSPEGLAAYEAERAAVNETSATLGTAATQLDRLEATRLELDSEPAQPLIERWYAKTLELVLRTGLIGESAALLGILGLKVSGIPTLTILAFIAATATLFMMGLMAQSAWLRFAPGDLSPRVPLRIALLVTVVWLGAGWAVFYPGSTPAPKESHPTHAHVHPTPVVRPSPTAG